MKMSTELLILFLCIVVCRSSVEYQTILQQISSGSSYCNNEKLFSNFILSDVFQFDALCNIPPPNTKQVKFLLEDSVVPILCMGLYDATLRLCKAASDDILLFSDIFPPSVDKFTKIFNTLNQSGNYSSLENFCSSTVMINSITEASSNITELWWHVLNKELQDKNRCMSICRTFENDRVQPLCSYIIWSNGIYLNYKKNQAESQATATILGEAQINTVFKDELKNNLKKLDQVTAKQTSSGIENLPSLVPPTSVVETLNPPPQQPEQPEKVDSVESNMTSHLLENSEQPNKAQDVAQEYAPGHSALGETVNPTQPKYPVVNKTDVNLAVTANMKPTVSTDESKKNDTKMMLPVETPKPVEQNPPPFVDDSMKSGVVSSLPSPSKPQDKLNTDKADVIDGDFNFPELTPEGIGMNEQIPPEKELPPPYSDEEGEDGDGDDLDSELEGPAKPLPNKAGASKGSQSKPSSITNDQVLGEPDKVYGDVEREILIEDHFIEAEDSHFFTYFLCMTVLTIMVYLAFHNKKKLLALAVEGRRTRNSRRRPNCSNYSKLDCSLEEALVSNTTASVTHVLY